MTRLVIILLLALPISARADEPVRLRSAAVCRTDGGSDVTLPPGVYLPEPSWLALDLEMRRLQDAQTRLKAENISLRKDLDKSGWGLTLKWAGVALLVGAGLGFAGGAHYF